MAKAKDPKQTIQTNAIALYTKHKDMTVTDDASYQQVGAVLVEIKGVRKQIKSVYQPIIDRENAILKATRTEYKKYDVPLSNLEVLLKRQLAAFSEEQEQKRLAIEAELQEKARQEAEDKKLAEAQKLEQMGEKEAAEAVLQEEVVVAPVMVDNKPSAQGVSTRKKWHAEVTDKAALVKAVASGLAAQACLEPNMKVLNQQAVALREELNIPGVKAVSEVVVSARSGE